MKKIAVLVSGGGTNLQALIDAQNKGDITGGKIISVISSSAEAYALERARNNNIEALVLNRKDYQTNQEYSNALLKLLKNKDIDLIVLAGFMTILTNTIIEAYPNRIINIHPALIPSFCGEGFYGLKVHEKALDYGVKISGATVHFVNQDCDGGPIILQKSVNINPDDTPEILQKRIMKECEWKILPEAVNFFCNDKIRVEGRKVSILE